MPVLCQDKTQERKIQVKDILCQKSEANHRGKRKDNWIGCDRCGRWFIEECVVETKENVDIRNHYWQCSYCINREGTWGDDQSMEGAER